MTFEEKKGKGKLTAEEIKKVEANNDTRIVFCDDIIFICVHLSSKAEKNKKELDELKEVIKILRSRFPGSELIIGGDTNVFVK